MDSHGQHGPTRFHLDESPPRRRSGSYLRRRRAEDWNDLAARHGCYRRLIATPRERTTKSWQCIIRASNTFRLCRKPKSSVGHTQSPVDSLGSLAARTRTVFLGPETFLTRIGRRLLVGRLHARGRGRGLVRGPCRIGLLLSQLLRQFQQREDNGFFALRENRPCLLFSEYRPPRSIERRPLQNLRACRHTHKS